MTASTIQPNQGMALAQPGSFNDDQIELIKNTVAVGTTDLELALFLEVAKSTGLNPFQRQIYAIKRKSGREEKMTIQTGIDGYRLIAARSGVHLGTTDAEFGPIVDGYPEWARVIVRKLVCGQVAEFPATARWSEYVQTKDEWVNNQRTGKKTVTDMWHKMPHTMLGKCSEALALRKAFPAELSGVYSDVEMAQADNPAPQAAQAPRTVDVTREVQQAAGTPERTTVQAPSPEALKRVRDIAEKVKRYGAQHVETILGRHDWQNAHPAAVAAYNELREFGLNQHALEQAHAQPEVQETQQETAPVMGEAMLTDDQRKGLQGHAARAGAKTSEERAALWAYCLNVDKSIRTNDLSEAQAAGVIAVLAGLSTEEAAQTLAEALKAALPF